MKMELIKNPAHLIVNLEGSTESTTYYIAVPECEYGWDENLLEEWKTDLVETIKNRFNSYGFYHSMEIIQEFIIDNKVYHLTIYPA